MFIPANTWHNFSANTHKIFFASTKKVCGEHGRASPRDARRHMWPCCDYIAEDEHLITCLEGPLHGHIT